MVVNGATKFGDMAHFNEQLESFTGDVTMEYLEESMQLLALQGPGAAEAIKKLLPVGFDLVNMAFMTGTEVTLDGIEGCRITRYVCVVLLFLCQTWLLLTHNTLLFCVTCIALHYTALQYSLSFQLRIYWRGWVRNRHAI